MVAVENNYSSESAYLAKRFHGRIGKEKCWGISDVILIIRDHHAVVVVFLFSFFSSFF